MKQSPSLLTRSVISGALFLGGAWAGSLYVDQLGTGFVASSVGFLMLPIAFLASLAGFAGANLLARAGRAARKRSLAAGEDVAESKGALVVVPICLFVGVFAGLIVGISAELTTPISPFSLTMRLGLVGLVYGIILWLLLRANLIAIPD